MKKTVIIFSLFIFLFSLFSCLTLPFGPGDTASSNRTPATLGEMQSQGYWITRPSGNQITIIGISGRRMRVDDEIAAAKEDAARKLSIFYHVEGRIDTVNAVGSNLLDFVSNAKIEINYDQNFQRYIDQLTYNPEEDLLMTDDAIYIRFRHNASLGNIGNYNVRMRNGRPEWTQNINVPKFPGYVTTVGFAQNQRRMQDTFYRSMENAIALKIQNKYTQMNIRESTVTGQGSFSGINTVSQGTLRNFYVLEYWRDPETTYLYTLAIARE